MSVLRRAVENRSWSYQLPVTVGNVIGTTGWQEGMVWKGGAPPGNVSTDQAMRLSAVFACLRILSEAVATLPVDTFRRLEGNRLPFERPSYLTFTAPQMSRIDYLSQVMLSLLTDGNAYVLTPRDGDGVPLTLVVLDPAKVSPKRRGGEIVFEVEGKTLDGFDVTHIKGMSLPGCLTGLSPIAYARETIDLGLAAQRFGSSFFTNGGLPSAVIEVDGSFSEDAAKRFQQTWHGQHNGVGNANKVGVLTGGARLTKVSLSPEDAQFLGTRAFQVPDVARIFGVPPHLIADASGSTSWGSGLAEQNLAFGQFSLRPWTERIEDAHNRLLSSHALADVFVKLNLDALLRASLADRYASYEVGIRGGFMEENEARALEELPPLPARITATQIEQVGALVRAGFDAEDALRVLGVPPIKHTGNLPVTLQGDA